MAPRLRNAVVRFDALPEEALRIIMFALPVDARARAACVCRSWRAFLADPTLWQVLDLTPAGGVAARRVTENLVRGAVARAVGQLREVSLSYLRELDVHQLLAIASDGGELRQVNIDLLRLGVDEVAAVFAAAPRLQALNTNVAGRYTELLPLLRNDPPFGPLQISSMLVLLGDAADADVLAFAAAVAAHESLKSLVISETGSARVTNAMMDAAAERQVSELTIDFDSPTDAGSVSALARLFQRGSLTELQVFGAHFPRAPEASVLELCAALRACRKLTHLELRLDPPNGTSRRIITELLDATASLPALRKLDLCACVAQDTLAFGRSLGALLAANPPSLRHLDVVRCNLGEEGVAAVLDGLAANTHLRTLDCDYQNGLSAAFVRDRLVPAVAVMVARRANLAS